MTWLLDTTWQPHLARPLDVPALQVGDYWGWFNKRSYHHTGPVSTFYAMREALAVIAEEGLDNMWCVMAKQSA
jgi:aspartate aminotransferase-like enzyme